MPLRERVDFMRVMFYAGYQAGVSYASHLASGMASMVDGETRKALEILARTLSDEAVNASLYLGRETFTTKYESDELLEILKSLKREPQPSP